MGRTCLVFEFSIRIRVCIRVYIRVCIRVYIRVIRIDILALRAQTQRSNTTLEQHVRKYQYPLRGSISRLDLWIVVRYSTRDDTHQTLHCPIRRIELSPQARIFRFEQHSLPEVHRVVRFSQVPVGVRVFVTIEFIFER